MESLPLWQIVVAFITSAGGVVGLIKLYNEIAARIEQARVNRNAVASAHISGTNQREALQLQGLEFTQAGFVKLVEILQNEIIANRDTIAELRDEVAQCEKDKDAVHAEIRRMRIEINNLTSK